jgi:hypothetical protein
MSVPAHSSFPLYGEFEFEFYLNCSLLKIEHQENVFLYYITVNNINFFVLNEDSVTHSLFHNGYFT